MASDPASDLMLAYNPATVSTVDLERCFAEAVRTCRGLLRLIAVGGRQVLPGSTEQAFWLLCLTVRDKTPPAHVLLASVADPQWVIYAWAGRQAIRTAFRTPTGEHRDRFWEGADRGLVPSPAPFNVETPSPWVP